MKKILILLLLAFTMLVACSEAKNSHDPNNLEVGDTGTVQATQKENGDWQFDYTGLGVSDLQTLTLVAEYHANDIQVAEIGKLEAYGKYVWNADWLDTDTSTMLNAMVDIPSDANALKPVIPASTNFVFADNDTTIVFIAVEIDGKLTGIVYEGQITNGNGTLEIISIVELPIE